MTAGAGEKAVAIGLERTITASTGQQARIRELLRYAPAHLLDQFGVAQACVLAHAGCCAAQGISGHRYHLPDVWHIPHGRTGE
ncbi:MAG TPA: hypothetical protein VFZ66_29755 [Herpetosiphonaceae bacterium]